MLIIEDLHKKTFKQYCDSRKFYWKASARFFRKIIALGAYAIAYAKNKNDMPSRGVPQIELRPSNDQGGNYFISILTGKCINTYHWEESPINDQVTIKVEELVEK